MRELRHRLTIVSLMMVLAVMTVRAQIIIGGNVYGGGNKGNVDGSSSVTVRMGDMKKVFGGARMANVGGNSYVNIDGAHASGYMVIDHVYGGNDIAGTIGTAAAVGETLPTELVGNPDNVDNTWNSYVHISTKAEDGEKIFIGQAFAGGNGDYKYELNNTSVTTGTGASAVTKYGYNVYQLPWKSGDPVIATITVKKDEYKPELDKTYLDIQGGTIAYGYGGGNNATVRDRAVIHVDNPSDDVVTHILVDETTRLEADDENYADYEDDLADGKTEAEALPSGYTELLNSSRLKFDMGISTAQEHIDSPDFQIGRLFGGNNRAEMDIMPTWNLQQGRIRNLYSGGNRGDMTCYAGLLLEINPLATNTKPLKIDNVFGGCRMANVIPKVNGVYTPVVELTREHYPNVGLTKDYNFPTELSARVLVHGGDVNNVYGGNDVTGNVRGGNAVGIYTTIRGNVYGGGNGSYAYTDKSELKDDEFFGDYYYDKAGYSSSVDALNDFRPNAEQVSIRLKGGDDPRHPTIIKGAVYIGGNCATLDSRMEDPLVELKIGSNVVADKVFLGNNGEPMIDEDVLKLYAGSVKDGELTTGEGSKDFSSLDLTDSETFAGYMEGVVMDLKPEIVFDSKAKGDPDDYDDDNASYVGSFYCGGNVGSMGIRGSNTYEISRRLNIYEKFVGGCNNADVAARDGLNAAYSGGVLGIKDERQIYTEDGNATGKIKDRLVINLDNLTITPLRWSDENKEMLIWNTNKWDDVYSKIENGTVLEVGTTYYTYDNNNYTEHTVSGANITADGTQFRKGEGFVEVPNNAVDATTRLLGGNVYGGCYNSGHVNGNVIININEDVLKRDEVFDEGVNGRSASGVIYEKQRDDEMALALTVFGAGCGEDTEIWGSTTVNLNNGYAFQIFGGGEEGVVGKKNKNSGQYEFDLRYSSTVNLNGGATVYSSTETVEDLAETEYIYGGGNEGDVCGNTYVNLGQGRVYDAFGGAANADILGHTEVYIGRQPNANGGYKDGFPWIKDIVYGGNDFGGTIHGTYESGFEFTSRVRDWTNDQAKIHRSALELTDATAVPEVLKGATYVEYLQGRVDTIHGGSYGYYNYTLPRYSGAKIPYQPSSFVNIRPKINNDQNAIKGVYGGGTGYPGYRKGDESQDRSYVLIDIAEGADRFKDVVVFGSGSYNGMGMRFEPATTFDENWDLDQASAIVDLLRGQTHNVYGGSFNEGITRRTVMNVPEGSTIKCDNIFGGAYGMYVLPPCDVYESNVNYRTHSEDARVFGAIYGGNNKERRTLYTHVNISAPVITNDKGYTGTVYGAGKGVDTWSEYTEVNLEAGARVYNVFGGGEMGHVLNAESIEAYMHLYSTGPSPQISTQDNYWKEQTDLWVKENGQDVLNPNYATRWASDWKDAWTFGKYYVPNEAWNNYAGNANTNISRVIERPELDDKTAALLHGKKYNTHVLINEGATVEGYAYGGGYGEADVERSGDTYGSTYIALLGGTVIKDVYAAGRAGGLDDLFDSKAFTASANAYVKGGMCRNVYGGGYLGHVGHHSGNINEPYTGDRLADVSVVVGKVDGTSFTDGVPAINRNVYGGGEGGSVYGTAHVTVNNGMIGYRYKNTADEGATPVNEYVEELDDAEAGDNLLETSGNVFGGGYVVNSYVDETDVKMYGGTVRSSLYGGGEIGPIGRGTIRYARTYTQGVKNGDALIFRAGKTLVRMFNGHVMRNVFGGGRGKDNWGGDGTKYMDEDLVATLDLDCKGYVFGQTEVRIHGGEIGSQEGLEKETETGQKVGNVFGGGDEGCVYSAYMDGNNLRIGKKDGVRYDGNYETGEGYYYKSDGTNYFTYNVAEEGQTEKRERDYTEDCKVVVEPWCQVKKAGGIQFDYDGDGTKETYAQGDYIPTAYLNTLPAKTGSAWPAGWDDVDTGTPPTATTAEQQRGIIIHNAVFAGGNIAAGSSSLIADATTVFGNATASINDVYNRDLITIGTGNTGGLYGDGDLTFVDGYRGLNITNYGSDYFHLDDQLTYAAYEVLPEREKAYYEVKYKCLSPCTDIQGTKYTVNSNLPLDELVVLFLEDGGTSVRVDGNGNRVTDGTGNPVIAKDSNGKWMPSTTYWEQNGVVSTYAGRIMNTIQRADFCGVFGSRMVMKGARDRVVDSSDRTLYTINRVREVSLNKKDSPAHDSDERNKEHGNYFGIYSLVNYLGALTSDVSFDNVRTTKANLTNRPDLAPDEDNPETFYQWKAAHYADNTRNNGSCHNKVALASGVYLELTTEKSTGTDVSEKDWGLITGVVELDLINVKPGIGGGFVYAKNQHGVRTRSGNVNTTLTALNEFAVTQRDWNYDTSDATKKEWETSGNFIHSSQTIIDDCYNISNRYKGTDAVKAHYWYISGSVYVYDQYITAYTGVPNAYSETVEIPITITAASNGRMTLMDVQPNLYAYYSSYTSPSDNIPLTGEAKVVINDVEYSQNTPISYWEWYKLPVSAQRLFVDETYVTTAACKIGDDIYPAGYVMLPGNEAGQYDKLKSQAVMKDLTPNDKIDNPVKAVVKMTKDDEGHDVVATDDDGNVIYIAFDEVFHSSNNMAHETGYALTYNVTNPQLWETWYTPVSGAPSSKNQTGGANYEDGPTYHPTTAGLYGQREYSKNDIIAEKTYLDYQTLKASGHAPATGQAEFEAAYLVTKEYISDSQHYYEGAPIPASVASSLGDNYKKPAYVCTHTIELSETEFIYVNELMTAKEKSDYYDRFKPGGSEENAQIADEINKLIVPAYYCTTSGLYGGDYYAIDHNYRALGVLSSMTKADRDNFTFNYDALDLLIDSNYGGTDGQKYQYDSEAATLAGANANAAHYSLPTSIDYTATYNSDSNLSLTSEITVKRGDSQTPTTTSSVQKDDELTREVYESLPNERRHYAAISVDADGTYYVVRESFMHGETPYAVGTTIDSDTYSRLSDMEKDLIDELYLAKKLNAQGKPLPYYYCRDSYTVNEHGEGVEVTTITTGNSDTGNTKHTYNNGDVVPLGEVITSAQYEGLVNKQMNFTIHGVSPMETSTLYVSRFADIDDLSTEKIITVMYKYDYEEVQTSGVVTPVSERHIVNIHITFESGVPTVEDIRTPDLVLPGTSITIKPPHTEPGAFEIIGSGWELFEKESDAESHINGKPYTPVTEPLYWYQDGFFLAYYAKTYGAGKTYSNYVPVSVANYHDLKKVMDDKEKHLNVDYDRTRLKRDAKVYINDYSESGENGLDLLKDFYDLSLMTTAPAEGSHLEGHSLLNNSTASGTNIYNSEETNVKGVRAGKNLEFFLRTDIERGTMTVTHEVANPEYDAQTNPNVPQTIPVTTTEPVPWTPIGANSDDCFKGVLHGDGHHLSGLDHSLFQYLCGEVYNLGVSGPFTGAGVAESGSGYVESCWISSSSDKFKTSAPVFGTPYRTEAEIQKTGSIQMVNCYYEENDDAATTVASNNNTSGDETKYVAYTNHSGVDYGIPTRRTSNEFYTGKVAYDLNNFYLYSRYNQKMTSTGDDLQKYRYLTIGDDDNLVLSDYQYYAEHPDLCSSGTNGLRYVEDRFADGDFRFSDGSKTIQNERYYVEKEINPTTQEEKVKSTGWYPIWPDDYIFFGQKLTYGHDATSSVASAHQDYPTTVVRDEGRLSQNADANRVYRAPAYYRSSTMGTAYFNPTVYLAQKEKLTDEQIAANAEYEANGETNKIVIPREAYPNMTAIDFAGHNNQNVVNGTYTLGTVGTWFYQPLLDDDGLVSIENIDETRNLLVYAPAESATSGYANKKTHDVLASKFVDPVFNAFWDRSETQSHYSDGMKYDRVAENDQPVRGHLVQSNLTATNDHLLVDKEDFNCPISYTFASGSRMWYQRKPADKEYVDRTKGWQGISLPFTSELVTTHQKGEMTHFYNGSESSKNNTGTKVGHEYWLREFTGIDNNPNPNPGAGVVVAKFQYPAQDGDGSETMATKTYTNGFLWDYYYNEMTEPHHKDKNSDTYQTYYMPDDKGVVNKYNDYALLTKAIPYIIGLPGTTYYEFDLSGKWAPGTTFAPNPGKLEKQVITFASADNEVTIGVSDDEMSGITPEGSAYTFKPNYLNSPEIVANKHAFLLNADGDKYVETEDAVPAAVAFRPFFIGTPTNHTRTIVFGNGASEEKGVEEHGNPLDGSTGTLLIYAKKGKIVVESSLSYTTDVRIVTPAGITVSYFTVKSGETVEVRVDFSGMYVVHTDDCQYVKKVAVKRE